MAEAQKPRTPVPPVLSEAQNPETPIPATLTEALKPLDAYLTTKLSNIELRPLHPQPPDDASRLNAMLLFSASGLTILCLSTAWACRRAPKRKQPRQ